MEDPAPPYLSTGEYDAHALALAGPGPPSSNPLPDITSLALQHASILAALASLALTRPELKRQDEQVQLLKNLLAEARRREMGLERI
ncbi:hypothetical protein RQP46_009608 [Phenoliferia psychrophenolica]